MLKKKFVIILTLIFLSSCEYKPIYSKSNKLNYKIIITEISGDKNINKFLIEDILRNSQKKSNKIINIQLNTTYTKIILAKDTAGNITNYRANVLANFLINKDQTTEQIDINEKFNYQKMTDKYEEKNYEKNIKKNLAKSISQKLIFRLSIPQ
tara:strand:+ start:70 stop:528 length:459 start_codon:yes stop_codon:yes gene_type:complete